MELNLAAQYDYKFDVPFLIVVNGMRNGSLQPNGFYVNFTKLKKIIKYIQSNGQNWSI